MCTNQEPVSAPKTHAHIVRVGIGDNPAAADEAMTLAQVLNAIDAGDTFYTKGTTSGKVAEVDAVPCAHCGHRVIRSRADAVSDNNLDSLRTCVWK